MIAYQISKSSYKYIELEKRIHLHINRRDKCQTYSHIGPYVGHTHPTVLNVRCGVRHHTDTHPTHMLGPTHTPPEQNHISHHK
jgi:hypothetical protein